MAILAVERARARQAALAAAARALPREKKREVMAAIDAHAPALRDLIVECDAVPIGLRVRNGNGWQEVLSPAIIREHAENDNDQENPNDG